MTAKQVSSLLGAAELNMPDGGRKITCGYSGDFLSFVMGRAPTDCVWFTVMSNVNVAAVATLAEVSLVVLCEDVQPDENLLAKVKQQGINLVSTRLDAFSAAATVAPEIR